MSLAEKVKIVEAVAPQTFAGAHAGNYISLKGFDGVLIIVHESRGAHAATMGITVDKATKVDATGISADIALKNWWACESVVATGDVWTKGTATTAGGGGITTPATQSVRNMYKIDIAAADLGDGYDCLAVKLGASNVAHTAGAIYILYKTRYKQAAIPSAIID